MIWKRKDKSVSWVFTKNHSKSFILHLKTFKKFSNTKTPIVNLLCLFSMYHHVTSDTQSNNCKGCQPDQVTHVPFLLLHIIMFRDSNILEKKELKLKTMIQNCSVA